VRSIAIALVLAVAAAPAAAQAPRLEAWAGAGIGAGKRNAAWAGSVGAATGTGPYVQAGLRYRFVALEARYLSAQFAGDSAAGAGRVSSRELFLSLGPRVAGLDVGYGQRTLRGSLAQRVWSYATVGGHLDLPIGSSGFRALAGLHLYAAGREANGATTATGLAGETALRFRPRSLPLFFLLGYRVERFTVSGTPSSPEEMTTVILGGGLAR
jgi:hypothetical protein